MAFCSNCGKPVDDTIRFCPSCGAPQQPVSQQPYQQPAPQQPYQQPQQPAPQQPYQQPQQPTYQQPAYQQPVAPSGYPVGAAVKKAGGFAKHLKWILPVVAFVVAAVVSFLIFGTNLFKSDETLIRERIQAYEDACNDGDMDAMLDCMDSETKALMEGTMGFMDGLFQEGSGMDFGMSDMFGFAGAMGDFFKVEITNIAIEGNYATVSVIMSADMYGYSEETEETELPMVKEGGDWYIGGMENMLGSEMFGI